MLRSDSSVRTPWPVVLLAALLVSLFLISPAPALASLSIKSFSAGAFNLDRTPSTEAGAHPQELESSFALGEMNDPEFGVLPDGVLKTTVVELPPGVVGNPQVVPQCREADLATLTDNCPKNTQIGYADVDRIFLSRSIQRQPVYNVIPGPGEAAAFRFTVTGSVVHVGVSVRGDGAVVATARNVNASAPLFGVSVHLWGVPADPSNDELRYGPFGPEPSPSGLPRRPFLRNSTACSGPSETILHASSWSEPSVVISKGSVAPETIDCVNVPFSPGLAVSPDSNEAGGAAGYAIDLKVPQNESPDGIATSDLKKVVMDLPRGVTLNSAGAAGLGACSDAQFASSSTSPASCPNDSKIAEVEVDTPLLEDAAIGSLYLGNPLEQSAAAAASGEMYRLFLEIEGKGVRIKLEGSVVPDPETGQLTATFDDNPQLPFENLHLELIGGPRSPLTTPKACGTYTTRAELTPWARPTEPVPVSSSFTIDEGCDNASKFEPALEAGTINPVAGGFSPFTLRITEPSGQQNLQRIATTLPEGLLAKLAGVSLCGDAQAVTGDCPAGSQVGTTTVGAGQGPSPIYVPQPGKAATAVYLAGPYKGAPYSLVVKVPAQAGPFDLGTVTVRNALEVDPTTTQVTAKSDPLPQILLGVPIVYRDVRVEIDRPGFTLNPTSCRKTRVTSTLTSAEGAIASPSDRFAVAGCGELGFNPSLKISLKGKMKRTGNPALTAVLRAPAHEANIAKTTVLLPRTAFIDNAHISNPCTRVQFSEGACPPKSILGHATAYTPLLDQPLRGPVYFRSNGGERELPDMVADLGGQIHVTLVGFIDSVPIAGTEASRVRTRFLNVPDAPVSKFVLKLAGGKKGLIENSVNLCRQPGTASVQMEAQNERFRGFAAPLKTRCDSNGRKGVPR